MSTVSSLLILASASLVKDLWKNYVVKEDAKRVEKYNKNLSKTSFLVTLAIGIIVLLLALTPPDIIFWINLFAMGGLECAFLWPIVGGVFYKKGNKQAALASSVVGVLVYIVSYQFKLTIFNVNSVVWGLLIGGIVYFIVGAVTCKNGLDEDVLEKCF